MFPRGIPKDRFVEDLIRQKPGRAEKNEKTVLHDELAGLNGGPI